MKPDASSKLVFEDLSAPLSADEFLEAHWLVGEPASGRLPEHALELILSVDGLECPDALLERHDRPVKLFGPAGERLTVPAAEAASYLADGYTVFFDYVHRRLPMAHQLFTEVGRFMGLEPWQLTLEAFAGRAGAVTTRHFDSDLTIQVQLQGSKAWVLESNRYIVNPLRNFHPPLEGQVPGLAAFTEEAYADNPDIDRELGGSRRQFECSAGSSLFLARGWWHSAVCRTDSWSVNVVFHSITWARAFARALEIRLHGDPALRDYVFCPPVDGSEPPSRLARRSTAAFERASERTLSVMRELTEGEVSHAILSFINRVYRWRSTSANRSVVHDSGGFQLLITRLDSENRYNLMAQSVSAVEHLVNTKHNFSWDHIPLMSGAFDSGRLYDLVVVLIADGHVEVVHAGIGAS